MKSKQKKLPSKLPVVPILVALAIILLLVVVKLLLFSAPTFGEAIRVPPTAPLDLTEQRSEQIDISRVTSWQVTIVPSSDTVSDTTYLVVVTDNKDGTVTYELTDASTPPTTLALGRLGPPLADTRGILVDDDAEADVEFHYSNGIFEVINLQAIAPPIAGAPSPKPSLTLLKSTATDGLRSPFTGIAGVQESYRVHTTNSTPISVTGTIDGQVINFERQNTIGATDAPVGYDYGFYYNFTYTPTVGPHQLILNALNTSNEVIAKETYTLGGDGVIYVLKNDAHYPETTITLTNDATRAATVSYTFAATQQKQPFSLPCTGRVNLAGISVRTPQAAGDIPGTTATAGGDISSVDSFNAQLQNPDGWRPEAPSEFYELSPFFGYKLELNNGTRGWQFSAPCTLPAKTEFPSLVKGWNLVGITGYEPAARQDFNRSKAPPGTSIISLRELQRDAAVSGEVSTLYPAKAYWVLVE